MKGMTLLEVLFAVSIMGIVMVVIYGAYTSNLETIQIARENAIVNQTARIVLDRMRKDLQSAIVLTSFQPGKVRLGMVGKDEEIDGRPADKLDFTSLAHVPTRKGGLRTDLCEVGYFVEEALEGDYLILYRRDDESPDEDFKEGGTREELARMVTGLDIVYEDASGKEQKEWNTLEGKPGKGLPNIVKVRLTLRDALGREHLFTAGVHPELGERRKRE
jgi:prepilin-type N-terminal cleavage/methylation domain-containing protein